MEELLEQNEKEYITLKMIKSIDAHNGPVNAISIFPSGNIISVSFDQSIKIYDINFNLLQNIKNAHKKTIRYVEVKDENNFVTCSFDQSIKTWIKNGKIFKLNYHIINAHDRYINKVIYYLNNYLISCSYDYTVKVWEEKDKNYQLITTLKHNLVVWSILILKDKNILISSGNDGTKLWNINNFEIIKYFNEVKCNCWNGMNRMDEDRIIFGGNKSLKIISLIEKKIIKEIKISFLCYGILTIEIKGIFLIGGESKNIIIYNNNNYECTGIINDAHDFDIKGFILLNNNLIASFSQKIIRIWSF